MSQLISDVFVEAVSASEPGDAKWHCAARLLVGMIVPCPVAALVAAAFFGIVEKSWLILAIMYPAILGFACIAGGVQFAIHSLLMEFVVWRVVGRNVVAVFVSALLGLLVGVSIWFLFGEFLETYMYAGFVAGLVSGCILYRMRNTALP